VPGPTVDVGLAVAVAVGWPGRAVAVGVDDDEEVGVADGSGSSAPEHADSTLAAASRAPIIIKRVRRITMKLRLRI
jgi:hypothetical protein